MKNIRLFKPCVGDDELEAVKDVIDRAWLGLGPKVKEFEEAWTEYLHCGGASVALNSATAALHLALNVYDFPENSEVLVPNITFVSTAHSVLYNKLKPVFVDIDEATLTICPDDILRKITDKTVAIIPVHLGGQPCDMNRILEIAQLHNLKVIEDCANCTGGSYQGKKLGTIGDIGCYSFEEKKNMTTGDGGMLFSSDITLIEKIKKIRWCGIDRDTWKRLKDQSDTENDPYHWYYEVADLGYKYNMNDLAASIGLVQLKKLDWMNDRRARLIQAYIDGLASLDFVSPAFPYNLVESGYWLFSVRVNNRNDFINFMKRNGIATGVHFMPMTSHPLYSEFKNVTPVSDAVWEELVTLPLFPELEEEDVEYVIKKIHAYGKTLNQ
jgi:perosamine synthetase